MITSRSYRGPSLRYHISARDRLCFHCPVRGGCNDSSPQCLRKLHKTAQAYIVLLRGAKTVRQVAAEIGQSQKTTARWLKSLQERGLVEQIGENGERKWKVREA